MDKILQFIGVNALVIAVYMLGAYAHEGVLIRQCKEDGQMYAWSTDLPIKCTLQGKDAE
jgi:hypothetical protein